MAAFEPQHADVMAALKDIHQHQLFTDFTIHLKDGAVHISRNLFAALSPVFRNMLTADMTEARTNCVDMTHITTEIWTCIMEFYFGSQKLVTFDNVMPVLEVSHMYELDRLTQYSCEYLHSMCSPENCLAVRRFAAKLSLESVVKKTTKIFADNFSVVCKSPDFLCLEKSELLKLLEKEELVTTEDDVCEALLAWIEANDADTDTCTEVFQHVRLEKVSDDFLANDVMYHIRLMRTPAIQGRIQKETKIRFKRSVSRQVRGAPNTRQLRDTNGSLVVAGRNPHNQISLYHWSATDRKWKNLASSKFYISGIFSTAACEGTVFVTGWYLRGRETFLFDLHSGTWIPGPDLLQGRDHHGMAVIRDRVYVVGGYNGKSLSSVEEFSMITKQWTQVGNLKVSTDCGGVTCLGDTILVAGGDTDITQRMIQTFNVETRTAAVLSVHLPCHMKHVRAARLGNTAFFVGSEGDLVQVREVEGEFQLTSHVQLQNFEFNSWFGLHVTDTLVRVIGGFQSPSVICWNHQGQEVKNDDVGDLPEKLCFIGLHEIDYFFP